MAAGDITKTLRGNVQSILGARPEETGVLVGRIYDAFNRIQRRIAEDALCIETSASTVPTITIVANTETYTYPTGLITERFLTVDGQTQQLEKVNMDRVEYLKRLASSETIQDTTDYLYYYYKWGDRFGFLRANGSAPSVAGTVNCWGWKYPTTTMGDSVDPEVSDSWKMVFIYGAVAEISSDPKWQIIYQQEFRRMLSREQNKKDESLAIPATRDYD